MILLEKLKGVQHSVAVMIMVGKMEILSLQKIVINLQHQHLLQQLPQQQLQLLQQHQQLEAVEATQQQLLSE